MINLAAGAVWCENMPHLKVGEYRGILLAPVHKVTFVPDLLLMHMDGFMISQLLNVRNWIDGKDVHAQLSGHAGCVYGIVPTMINRDCNVAIPCKGDRRYAAAQDDEFIFSIAIEKLPDFIAGARKLQKRGWAIPLQQVLKEEYELKKSYRKLAEHLGMDVNPSSQHT